MTAYASALSRHPVASDAIGETAGELLEQLGGDRPDLLVCFVSPHFAMALDEMGDALRSLLSPQLLLGCTASGIIGDASEIENGPALSLFAACIPGAELEPVALDAVRTPGGVAVTGWPDPGDSRTLVLLADPFTFPVESLLASLAEENPGLRVIGGLASAATRPGDNRLMLDTQVLDHGAVGVLVSGIDVRTVVSQGCRPIGAPFVVTRSEDNVVAELGGQSALARLQELATHATDDDRALLQRGLHMGIVVDEHKAEFTRGDFLVRNVLSADPQSGSIAVGQPVAVGQTVQFHVRDAAAADQDLRALLAHTTAAAALVFTCNGRGQHLFGIPDHDAGVLAEIIGPVPTAGAFCAGEIGPVGTGNFLHGFTVSLALFD